MTECCIPKWIACLIALACWRPKLSGLVIAERVDEYPPDHSPAAAGGYHSIFMSQEGLAHSTGLNDDGQLGDGSFISRSTVQSVMSGIQTAAAGGFHSVFLSVGGVAHACGQNTHGQLGDGTTVNRAIPVRVMSGVKAVVAGRFHTWFVKNDGDAYAVGLNNHGQLGDGTRVSRSNPVRVMSDVFLISAGSHHTILLQMALLMQLDRTQSDNLATTQQKTGTLQSQSCLEFKWWRPGRPIRFF